ncbi:fumarylacetoacetate hydrolase family protein [Cupriavidus alkaliphilus]|uniref:fumarylacetoacetate hydrolase family protein n=1 Tax=Cupriavidus alkaliphilus TaxID=942866 RepID=UPI000815914D|nr:fumarylacetoacetate hydrolase family protein [Cupriavidus alkaliphilus]SCB26818.1 2-keto-4-pentenoate hydratase/2-oxohepta-3-ene-1,7-dioic acid hydratase (catechol pathway) [Cupriavidus alkaliphilus]
MKLATFETSPGHPRIGLIAAGGIIDIARHLPGTPADNLSLIATWTDWQEALAGLASRNQADLQLASVTLLAPVPRPGKILGIGLNYADHVAESGMAPPPAQLWFAKMPTAANGPFAAIDLPLVSDALDYEAELAFVIGRRCRHVSREDAHRYIFGYCAANDVTVRDWQFHTSQFLLGKSFDTHAPFGPWIVTADEIPDPHRLPIRCFVNGELRQNSNTRHLVFDCFAQLEHLSKVMTLEPGDLVLTGTPGGVGWADKPTRALHSGDRVRVEIDGIGAIENVVQREEGASAGKKR